MHLIFEVKLFIDLEIESVYLPQMAECVCMLLVTSNSLSSVTGPKQRHRGLNTNTKNTLPPGSQRQVQAHPFLVHLSSCFYCIAQNSRWESQIRNQ